MSLPLLEAYLESIEPLRSEEELSLLTIIADPKPVWMIDPKKSENVIGQLFEKIKGRIVGSKPYWQVTELDEAGFIRLKRTMEEAQS